MLVHLDKSTTKLVVMVHFVCSNYSFLPNLYDNTPEPLIVPSSPSSWPSIPP